MKNRFSSEKRANRLTKTPLLDAVREEMAGLADALADGRRRLERQRRRVDALLWCGAKAMAPKVLLASMERSQFLKELYLDHLIEVSGETAFGGRLHSYDIDQRAQPFGVTAEVLRQTVIEFGTDLQRVETALTARHDAKLVQISSVDGAAMTSKGRLREKAGRKVEP